MSNLPDNSTATMNFPLKTLKFSPKVVIKTTSLAARPRYLNYKTDWAGRDNLWHFNTQKWTTFRQLHWYGLMKLATLHKCFTNCSDFICEVINCTPILYESANWTPQKTAFLNTLRFITCENKLHFVNSLMEHTTLHFDLSSSTVNSLKTHLIGTLKRSFQKWPYLNSQIILDLFRVTRSPHLPPRFIHSAFQLPLQA